MFEPARTLPPIADFPGLRQIREFFTGGNLIARVGVVVLFFGVAFLLRYVAEHSHFSIETRLSGVAVGALVLLALGWRWRRARRGYLAPVLEANPHGDHVALFSHFALLNCFVLIVAWFRSWRPLNKRVTLARQRSAAAGTRGTAPLRMRIRRLADAKR